MTLHRIPSKEVSQPDVSALEIAANEYTNGQKTHEITFNINLFILSGG